MNFVLDTQRAADSNGVLESQISGSSDTTAPVLTGALSFSAIANTTFRVSYPAATDNIGVAGYEISKDNGATYPYVTQSLFYDCTGETSGTLYYVKVRAYDAAGNRSNILAGTVTTTSVASTVTGVIVSPSTAAGTAQFSASVQGTNLPSQSVTWSLTGAGSINASTGVYTAPAATSSAQSAIVTATSVQDGTKSGTATVTIAAIAAGDSTPPTMIGSLQAIAISSSGFIIDWSGTTRSDNIAITGYEYNLNGSSYVGVGTSLSHTFAGLLSSASYVINVRAFDAAGNRSSPLSTQVATLAASNGAPALRTVTLVVVDATDTPIINLAGIKWAAWSGVTLDALASPIAQGSDALTDSTGLMTLNFTSTLTAGSVISLRFSESNGSVAQFPAPREFSGLVVLS